MQGARNRRERQLTRFALPYDYTCFIDGTSFYIELFGFFSRAPQEKYVLTKLVKEKHIKFIFVIHFARGISLILCSVKYKLR